MLTKHGATRPSKRPFSNLYHSPFTTFDEKARHNIQTLIAALIAGLFATSAFAQTTTEPDGSTATTITTTAPAAKADVRAEEKVAKADTKGNKEVAEAKKDAAEDKSDAAKK